MIHLNICNKSTKVKIKRNCNENNNNKVSQEIKQVLSKIKLCYSSLQQHYQRDVIAKRKFRKTRIDYFGEFLSDLKKCPKSYQSLGYFRSFDGF